MPLADLRQLESLLSVRETGRVTLSQYGFFIAFSACSSVIIYFVTKLTSELVSRDEALRQSQIRQARSEKWEALGTLAAGAAHELATPLTTIAVVSTELQRDLELQDTPEGLVEDFKTIRAELEKCRGILDQMSTDAGHLTTELPTIATIDSLLERAVSGPGKSSQRVKVNIANEAKESEISVPIQSFCMALGGIVQNALDASPEKPVEVIVSKEQQELCILVSDQGEGMSKEVLARADDPFFSTKETGRGMGLGRFLARTVFERLGGSLDTVSQLGVGTEVTIRIPLERRD